MRFSSAFKTVAITVALYATGGVALAQGGGAKGEEMKKAEAAARAEQNAKSLGQDPAAQLPPATVPVDPQNVWDLDLSTGGRVRIQLRPDIAPQHVERVKQLTRQGFYDGLKFHRVIPGFMAQGGDPKGDGTGGSSLPDLQAEFNPMPHLRGTVSMARAQDDNSANSQFFILFLPRMQLDKKYTVFGRVIEGMQYVDTIAPGEPPANPTTILQASIESDGKAPVMALPAPAVPSIVAPATARKSVAPKKR
ncbi:Peptidyl-prolyl cis-trans isomerase precursor [Sphingobium herbicidovorans NBRC 16415]|uniref:Peptidyl-prolyl cis-trans isomerase n=1 Tax=Sphingobium herbicidovorans (strain ATCC 700291 / DSM 11019 / CCUG 56400 / KCTC 2939 / LMG 18315 / NBRC 16415 / MH) TaxID=1219045 RepID=A0A086PF88_SPHHM|nr:peptidylprolyl isomerase [Sphingobium herbicidovorans]KFG92056.1 Peptidyl-prolyl cis-trans isomerase precursor [Sphingobium herbicidovorans NBRC 16415]